MGRLSVLLILFFTVVIPIWMVFHFIIGRVKSKRQRRVRGNLTAELQRVNQEFTTLEMRTRKLESYVTSSEFQLNREINKIL